MDDVFNPYAAWLGISDAEGLPDHYTLLGLPAFEKNPRQINSACDGMLARVRGHRPGPHLKEWQRLLDELNAAKACLLDPERREAYDSQLRRENGADDSSSASSSGAKQGSGQQPTYMWPPGMEPPGYEPNTGTAPLPPSGVNSASEPPTLTNVPTAQPVESPTAPEAPSAIPVLSPVNQSPPAPASTTASPPTTEHPSQPTAIPTAVPTAIPTAMPTGAPVAAPNAAGGVPMASPVASPPSAAPAYVPPTAAPVASPVGPAQPNVGNAYPQPPAGMPAGMGQAVDPMAPVNSQGAAPVAQPVGQYGQAPTAQPNYGQPAYNQPNYGQPQPQQPPYGQQAPYPAQAVPTAAIPSAMPVGVAGGMQTPQAMPVQSQPVTAQPVQAVPVAAASAEPELGLNVPTKSTSKAYKQSRKKNSVPMVIAAMMAASILVIVAFMIAIRDNSYTAQKEKQPKSAREMPLQPITIVREKAPDTDGLLSPLGEEDSKPKVKKPRGSTIGPLVEEGQKPESMPLIDPKKNTEETPESAIPEMKKPDPEPMPEPKTPVSMATPAETAAVRKALGQAIVAMGYRDWDTSDEMLAKADGLAPDDLLKEKVEAVRSLSDGAKEFWNAVKEAAKQLSAGQELTIGNSRVAVVESNGKLLILRVNGANRRYPIDDLPMGLARTLASSWFDVNAPSTKVFTGSFLLVEPNGDPDEVRQLWQAAKQGGVNMDLLMPLLDDDLKAEAGEDDAT